MAEINADDEGVNKDRDGDTPTPALKDLPGLAAFVSLGTTIATCVAVGVAIGLGVDQWWSLAPWGLVVGLVLGVIAAVVSVYKLARRWL